MNETVTQNKMAHSYSRLTTYAQCPLSYKLSYLDKVGTDDSDAMEIGAAAHEFFDRWCTQYKIGMPPEELQANILALAAKCFQKDARDQANFKEYLDICRIFALAYLPEPAYPHTDNEMQVAFNRDWKVCNWFDKDVYFRAKIDWLGHPLPNQDGKVTKIKIRDYKTGYAGKMDSFQLDVYAFVVSLLYPDVDTVEVEFFYTKSGFRTNKTLEVKDMDIVKIQLEALMDKIESENKFKAKPGARCLNCGVAAFCTKKPSDLTAIKQLPDAEALATDIALLEAQAKAKKKALNAWCKEQGPVTSGGLVFSFWPSEKMNVDFGPLIEACVKHQVDPAVVFNTDSTALKKLIRANPDFGDAITPYISMDVSYKFSAKKADE